MTLTAPNIAGTPLQHAIGLIVTYLVGSAGGVLFAILSGGIDFKIGKIGPVQIKPLLSKIVIPPLVGMIIFGCLARNFLCGWYMDVYPDKYAGEIRSICLSIILMRGGMTIDFTGKGLKVVILCIFPQLVEAAAIACSTRWLFDVPWSLSFASGFTIAGVSNSVVVPGCMALHNSNYGAKSGVSVTLVAGACFDNIIAITLFSIFFTIGFNEAPGGKNAGP
jgi:NhaP-type Na+/H+ or K+/H+ antiporter